MTDIVERLRRLAEEHYEMLDDVHLPMTESADEITALRAENERLRSALEDCIEILDDLKWNTGAVERARAALEGKQ